MPNLPFTRTTLSAALLAACVPACSAGDDAANEEAQGTTSASAELAALNLTQYVNPFIGTDPGTTPLPPTSGESTGNDYPGPAMPFGMVQFSPDTRVGSATGYRYSDTTIQDFSLTHFAGAGCDNNQDIQILPITGAVSTSPGTNWTSYASGYTKGNEAAAPGYYKTRLDKYSTNVELTASTRTGFGKLTFPATNQARLLVNTSRSATGSRSGSVNVSGSTVTGQVTSGNFCGSGHTFPIYFAIQFDRAPTGFGTWNGGTVSAGSASTSGTNTGAYVTFDTSSSATVQFKVAISFVSTANAQQNLTTEIPNWDFNAVRTNADTAWNNLLNRIQVSGGSNDDLQKFYTALYHVFQSPSVSSDVNGQYKGFDNAVHTASGMTVYQNYSGWDIYRSWAALMGLVAPDVMNDVVKSMVLDGQQGGLLPKWSNQTVEDFIMTGDPGPIIVASAYAFGARNFDTTAALSLMDKASNGGTMQGSPIRGRQSELVQNGFISGNASDSLEYSASDFAVATFAKSLGNTSSYNTHISRAQWWFNVFSTESSYINTRNSDKSWKLPLDPGSDSDYTEGSAAQYTWMITYNFASLIDLMGGPETAVQRLNHHFTRVNEGHNTPYFWIGNEPEHGVPWAYNFARYPAGASSAVRRIMSEAFHTGPGGLPGNDDLGATSAWYVWAALGMYPAIPGADVLALHGPTFNSITIQRAAGNIQINGGGAPQYVQGMQFNGAAQNRSYLRYSDIASGGTISYTMGNSPSASWGTGAGDVPPSFNEGWTPPPKALNLGTNLARGKAASGSTPCAAAESADKAFDGALVNNSKWCSTQANAFLQVDLGSAQTVSSVVIKHAGLGGETTGWNTGAFNVQTSLDNANWTTVASTTGNRSSRTFHAFAARQARYVKLTATTPTNNGNNAARIYEFEVYGSAIPTGAISGLASKCADVNQGSQTNGTKVQLYDCNSSIAQQWSLPGDGTVQAVGKCLDVTTSGTANGTKVQLWDCNASGAQQWVAGANGSLRNPQSGRCLDVPNSATENGTQLQIYDCNASAAQQWALPH
ncbi:GH92 family glycosyl hydrolase [Pendulispora brunnea]|uniref:GH92 family glycosyl hydrolase n=1 Tax=Pendulispora brunnea TaxID=2905690 RepID=A0ABZ2KG25_9BACT